MANATKLLILHVPAGGGHKAAACAIAEAAAARGAEVEVQDALELTPPWFARAYVDAHLRSTEHTPAFYGYGYSALNQRHALVDGVRDGRSARPRRQAGHDPHARPRSASPRRARRRRARRGRRALDHRPRPDVDAPPGSRVSARSYLQVSGAWSQSVAQSPQITQWISAWYSAAPSGFWFSHCCRQLRPLGPHCSMQNE